MSDLFTNSGAAFSPCGRYRYRLWRIWEPERGLVNFLMLNPSVADATTNDPTVERCERRAVAWGHGGLVVTNLFAWRSTAPQEMLTALEPIGPENDAAIQAAAREARCVVCAWGQDGKHRGRDREVMQLLYAVGVQPWALKVTKKGQPQHPLYLPYHAQLRPFG